MRRERERGAEMSVDRLERIDSLLKRVIADAMFRLLQSCDVSAGSITVTGVRCAKDLRNATVRVSVFGDEAAKAHALGCIIARTRDFERIVNREVRMKFTPKLRFEIDRSLEKGDRVLAIIDEIKQSSPEAGATGGQVPPAAP